MSSIEKPENIHMGQVVPGVWVGSLAALSHLDTRKRKWSVISILSSNQMIKMTSDMLSKSTAPVQEHIVWILRDDVQAELLSELHLRRIFAILDQTNSQDACLIHCSKGSSRSVSACAAWLLYSRKFTTLESALTRIRRVRPNASPNLGFLASLRALEQCHGNLTNARERMNRSSSLNCCNGKSGEDAKKE
jgi:predicted protein tyrosine phosphatase